MSLTSFTMLSYTFLSIMKKCCQTFGNLCFPLIWYSSHRDWHMHDYLTVMPWLVDVHLIQSALDYCENLYPNAYMVPLCSRLQDSWFKHQEYDTLSLNSPFFTPRCKIQLWATTGQGDRPPSDQIVKTPVPSLFFLCHLTPSIPSTSYP